MLLYIKVGSSYETVKNQGITHLLEHLSFTGTEDFPNSQSLSKAMQGIGAAHNAWVSRDHTRYWINLPYNRVEKGLNMLYQLTFKQLIDKKEVDKEKNVIASEYDDFWSNPDNKFGETTWQKRFKQKDHPYTFRGLGKPKSVNQLKKEDLLVWRSKYFVPANMFLVISGNVKPNRVKKYLAKTSSTEKPGKTSPVPKFEKDNYSNFDICVQKENREQISFMLTFPLFGYKESSRIKRTKFNVLTYILGGGFNSRLFQRLREKERIVYKIRAGSYQVPWAGDFSILGSAPKSKLVLALQTVREELDKLIDKAVGKEEFNLSREYLSASSLISFDSTNSICYSLGGQILTGEKIWFPDDYIKEVKKIKSKDIQALAKKYIDYKRVNLGFMGSVDKTQLAKIEKIYKS